MAIVGVRQRGAIMATTAKTKEQRELEGKVRRRKEFVTRIVAFVERLTVEKGRRVFREESSDHTHVIYHLLNFADFSFYYESGETFCGGNDVRVWYHPGKEMTSPDLQRFNYPHDTLVLDVDYQCARCDFTDKGDEIKAFDRDGVWQRAIRYMMKNKDRIIAKLERDKKKAEAVAQKLRDAETNGMRLVSDAARLRV